MIFTIGREIGYCQGNEILTASPVQRSINSTTIEDHSSRKMDHAAIFMLQKCVPCHKIYIIYGWDGNVQFWVLGMFASNSPDRRNLICNEMTINNEGPIMTWRRRLMWLESLVLYGQFLYWFYDTGIYSILKEVMWINSIFSPSSLIGYHRLPLLETLSVVKGPRDEFYVFDIQ